MTAYQITQTITDPGTAPARTDPANFDARADAFLAVLSTWGAAGTGDLNVLKTQMNALSTAVNGYSTTASAAQTAAEAAEDAAVAASNATQWLVGTTYAEGAVVWGSDSKTYRSAQGSNTGHNPVGDGGTWWVQISGAESGVNSDITSMTGLNDNGIPVAKISNPKAYQEIPIAWANGGTSEPDALDSTTRTPYAYRTFAHDADEDLNFVWFVPANLTGSVIQFRVFYLVTNATGPSSEGVAFGLSGVSLGDNDATNGAKGTVVVVTDPTITAAQHDVLITPWSGDVTITNLAAGEVAELAFIRDVSDAADDYAQVVGVFMIQLRYTESPAE